jgi:hypothetical protein
VHNDILAELFFKQRPDSGNNTHRHGALAQMAKTLEGRKKEMGVCGTEERQLEMRRCVAVRN